MTTYYNKNISCVRCVLQVVLCRSLRGTNASNSNNDPNQSIDSYASSYMHSNKIIEIPS